MSTLAALDSYKTLLANTAEFLSISGAANATAALDFIHIEVEDAGLITRTGGQLDAGYAIIANRGQSSETVAGGTKNFAIQTGSVMIQIVDPIASDDRSDDGLARRTFLAKLQNLKAEMEALSGSSGYISVHSMEIPAQVWRGLEGDIPEKGHFMWAEINSTWGL